MFNFIPNAFTGEEDTCPVCIARMGLEGALVSEETALNNLGVKLACTDGVGEELARAYTQLRQNFQVLSGDYRVSFAINLAIWFSAERYGRTKKVPDLLLAYDEYRDRAVQSFTDYNQAFEVLAEAIKSSVTPASLVGEYTGLLDSHKSIQPLVDGFWKAVDGWTVKRREDAFGVV